MFSFKFRIAVNHWNEHIKSFTKWKKDKFEKLNLNVRNGTGFFWSSLFQKHLILYNSPTSLSVCRRQSNAMNIIYASSNTKKYICKYVKLRNNIQIVTVSHIHIKKIFFFSERMCLIVIATKHELSNIFSVHTCTHTHTKTFFPSFLGFCNSVSSTAHRMFEW